MSKVKPEETIKHFLDAAARDDFERLWDEQVRSMWRNALAALDALVRERDEARAEVERLKAENNE